MSQKFLIRRRVSLAFLGQGWEECYIEVRPLQPNEMKEILGNGTTPKDPKAPMDPKEVLKDMAETDDLIRRCFLSGRALGADGQVVDLTAEDSADISMEVSAKLTAAIMGTVDKNLEKPSTN